jgi:phosphatidylserine/phosphatidylglycerophosphate/cardiolipin synthase-like enzyme
MSQILGAGPLLGTGFVPPARDGRAGRPSPILERCSLDRQMEVRYVVEYRHKAQMFQMHAKLVCIDESAAYIGSANLTDTSIHYNLELGVVTRDPGELRSVGQLFEFVWSTMAVPAKRLWGGRSS